MKRKKTLLEIVDYIKRRLGSDVVFLETSDLTFEDIVLDALAFVSEYKPKVIAKTIQTTSSSGKIQFVERVYPTGWVKGNALPEETPVEDVVTFLNVEPAESTNISRYRNRGYYGAGIIMPDGYGAVGLNYNNVSTYTTRYIDYKIMDYNLSSIQSLDGYQFDWMRDENDYSSVFYANLPYNVNQVTIEVGVEHSLGSYVEPPADDAPDGSIATVKEYTITGSIMALTQDLARGMAMESIGEIRSKVAGGKNSTPLNGQDMVTRGVELQDKVKDSLVNNIDLWGMFAD